MSNTKHTPEPWVWHSRQNGGIIITHSDGVLRSHVARLNDATLCPEHGTIDANAARIVACVNGCAGIDPAAVPALLAALEELEYRSLVALGIDGGRGTLPNTRLGDALRQARAAISKAKGETTEQDIERRR